MIRHSLAQKLQNQVLIVTTRETYQKRIPNEKEMQRSHVVDRSQLLPIQEEANLKMLARETKTWRTHAALISSGLGISSKGVVCDHYMASGGALPMNQELES